MKHLTITIMLAFISSASIAQNKPIDAGFITNNKVDTIGQNKLPTLINITFTLENNPVLTWEKGAVKGEITPVDTTYEMYGDKPLRRITYRYETREGKPMEVIEKDVYNGKDWDFNSITIQPYKNIWGIGNTAIAKGIQQYYNDNPIIYFNGSPIYPTSPPKPAKKQNK